MLVNNPMVFDSRVEKEAMTLKMMGLDVYILGTGAKGLPQYEEKAFGKLRRIHTQDDRTLQVTLRFAYGINKFLKPLRELNRSKTSRPVTNNKTPLPPNETLCNRNLIKTKIQRIRYAVAYHLSTEAFGRASHSVISELKPDLLHCHDLNSVSGAIRYSKRRSVPLIYDSHELWLHRNLGELDEQFALSKGHQYNLENRILSSCVSSITVCESISDYLKNEYSCAKPEVIRNLPSMKHFTPDTVDVRSHLGLKPNEQIMMYSGKLTSHRGIEIILRCMSKLPKKVHFVLMGPSDPIYLNNLKDFVNNLELDDRIHFLPPVAPNQVSNWLSSADLALSLIVPVSLSYKYCLPNKVFEAIHAGTPLIVSDLPELRKLVETHHCGVAVDTSNDDLICKEIMQILDSPEALREISENAKKAAQELNWEREESKLQKIYSDLL